MNKEPAMHETSTPANIELSCSHEAEHVLLHFNGQCEIRLSPHEARALATRLIAAVSRVEVKGNLGRAQSFQRADMARHQVPAFTPHFAR
jgi:hypothetical protein